MNFDIDLWIFGRIWSPHSTTIIQLGSIHNKYVKYSVTGLKRGIEVIWERGTYIPRIWIRIKKKRRLL